MKLSINTQALVVELRLLNKVIAAKTTLPILSNVLLRATDILQLLTTDLEIGFTTTCSARITDPGVITLPAQKLLDIVEQLPDGEVEITADKQQTHVVSGAFHSRLQMMPADDFPTLPTIEGDVTLLPDLRPLLSKVRYAIAEKNQRYTMNGALLSLSGPVLAFVATDGKRLAIATVPRQPGVDLSVVLPTKTIDVLLSGEGALSFSSNDRHLFFQSGRRLLISRTVDGEFPRYDRIIPRENDKQVVVNRQALAAVLRRVGIVSEDNQAVYFSFSSGVAHLSASSMDVGLADEAVAVRYDGPDSEVCLNWRFVLNFLEAALGETVTIALKDAMSPILFTDGSDYLCVVMGMRL